MRKFYHLLGKSFVIFSLFSSGIIQAQVVVTPATSVSNVCVNGGYKTLSDIEIKEGVVADFVGSGQTYVISPPANFEFKPGTGTVTKPLVSDISFVGISVTSSSATIFYNVIAVPAVIDSLIISGLEVRATGSASTGNITQTAGLPVTLANHGTLTSILPSVTLSPISAVCVNASPVALSGGSPGPGTFSGLGVSGSNFYPSVAGVGNHPVTYSYTDGNGCSNTAVQNITVNALPSTTLPAFSQANICKNASPIALPVGSPSGGTYSGPGISGSNFNPSLAATGINTITYTYTNGNGCTTSANSSINVNALPAVTLGTFADRCVNSSNLTLSGGSPGGGVFSGTGVSGTTFNPATAGAGTHTITYTYTDGNGCANSASNPIEVHALPGVTFSGLNTTYCLNASVANLTGFPSGGTFSGTGMSGTSFNPATAGVGGPYVITYSYTDGNGCVGSTTASTTVLEIPSVTISGLDDAYSESDNYDNITGTQSPPGGTIEVSGPGVSNLSHRFYPSSAGVGTHTIVRAYSHPTTGCINFATKDVTVGDNTGGTINGLESIYCLNSPVDNISGSPANGYFTGNGITNGTPGNATFNPALAGGGFHYVYYWFQKTVMIFGFPFTYYAFDLRLVEVRQEPVIGFSGLNSTYCQADANVVLTGSETGGTFSGPGVFGNNFSPSTAGVGTHSITYTYTTPYGCTKAVSQNTTVHANPATPNISGLSAAYCEDALDVTLSGSPSGGAFSGFGMKTGNVFSPSLSAALSGGGSKTITYVYTNANNCSATTTQNTSINLKPTVSFSGFPSDAKYCIDALAVTLTPAPAPSGGNDFFKLKKTLGDSTITNIFDPAAFGVGTFIIFYDYTDGNGCNNKHYDTVVVNPLPQVDFIGLDTAYCHEIGVSYKLRGINPKGPTRIFTGPGMADTSFFPALAGVGQHTIVYNYTDPNGCFNSTSKSTTVYARPKADYSQSSLCEGDMILFSDSSSVVSTAQAPSTLDSWLWDLGGQSFTTQNASRTFFAGTYNIKLTVTTDRGCDTTLTRPMSIGPYPKANFSWSSICDGDITDFTNLSTITALGTISTYTWDFDDMSSTASTANTNHTFSTPGVYDVKLKTVSDKQCADSIYKKVFILPRVSSYPYYIDFESGDGGWIPTSVYDTSSTWELGFPVKSAINAAASGTNCWVTNLAGTHKKSEESFVYSPCFDFSSMIKPMYSMDINYKTISDNAGAVLQYSLDEGSTWSVLGQEYSGLNWYNSVDISGQLSIQPGTNQFGWTGDSTNGWVTSRHNLNGITNNKVMFRVAFGADGSDNLSEGFAFDNVWIGERSKVLLIEHFTNSSSNFTAPENSYINNLVAANTNDVLCLQYHTSFPGTDPMNTKNPSDPSGRVLYYGTTQVPRSVLDGNYFNGNTLALEQIDIDRRSLEDPEFLINLSADNNIGNVAATATITAQVNITNPVTVSFAVIERRVTAVTGTNGETEFQWVLTKLMPDAAGTSFSQNWVAGDNQTVSQTWYYGPGEVYDPSQIGVIAFVQDNVTKEVYQATYVGPEGPSGGPVLSINKKADPSLQNMLLYPNPVASAAFVVFNEKAKENLEYVVYDEIGKIVGNGKVLTGDEGIIINTENLVSGVYVVKIGSDKLGSNYMKFVVSH